MQVIEILSIEASEYDHVAANKARTMSSSGLWNFDIGLHGFHRLLL